MRETLSIQYERKRHNSVLAQLQHHYQVIAKKVLMLQREDKRDWQPMDFVQHRVRLDAVVTEGRKIQQLLKERPVYFGRIDVRFADSSSTIQQVYIGKLGFQPDPNGEILIHDWRAPICRLYYQHILGYAGRHYHVNVEVTLRRTFDWSGDLNVAESEYLPRFYEGPEELEEGFHTKVDKFGDKFLQLMLSRCTTGYLRNIVRTIAREQDAAIRSESSKILISGGAGTGKTVVALHRIAYLLYAKRSQNLSSKVIFVSPSKLLSNYASHVLFDLGETKPVVVEINSLFKRIVKALVVPLGINPTFESKEQFYERMLSHKIESALAAVEFKHSLEWQHVMPRFLEHYSSQVAAEIADTLSSAFQHHDWVKQFGDVLINVCAQISDLAEKVQKAAADARLALKMHAGLEVNRSQKQLEAIDKITETICNSSAQTIRDVYHYLMMVTRYCPESVGYLQECLEKVGKYLQDVEDRFRITYQRSYNSTSYEPRNIWHITHNLLTRLTWWTKSETQSQQGTSFQRLFKYARKKLQRAHLLGRSSLTPYDSFEVELYKISQEGSLVRNISKVDDAITFLAWSRKSITNLWNVKRIYVDFWASQHVHQLISARYEDAGRLIRQIQKDVQNLDREFNLLYEDLAPMAYIGTFVFYDEVDCIIKTYRQAFHVVIDEAQDLSPIEHAWIKEYLCGNAGVTVAGDFLQRASAQGSELEDLEAIYAPQEHVRFKYSYRSSAEITAFAQKLSRAPDEYQPIRVGGLPPVVMIVSDKGRLYEELLPLIANLKRRYNSVALLCKKPSQARSVYEAMLAVVKDNKQQFGHLPEPELLTGDYEQQRAISGLFVSSIPAVKGLEFDAVILCEVSDSEYAESDIFARRVLYIGCTRALHCLFLLCDKKVPNILPKDPTMRIVAQSETQNIAEEVLNYHSDFDTYSASEDLRDKQTIDHDTTTLLHQSRESRDEVRHEHGDPRSVEALNLERAGKFLEAAKAYIAIGRFTDHARCMGKWCESKGKYDIASQWYRQAGMNFEAFDTSRGISYDR
jgi:DNA helicase IV